MMKSAKCIKKSPWHLLSSSGAIVNVQNLAFDKRCQRYIIRIYNYKRKHRKIYVAIDYKSTKLTNLEKEIVGRLLSQPYVMG